MTVRRSSYVFRTVRFLAGRGCLLLPMFTSMAIAPLVLVAVLAQAKVATAPLAPWNLTGRFVAEQAVYEARCAASLDELCLALGFMQRGFLELRDGELQYRTGGECSPLPFRAELVEGDHAEGPFERPDFDGKPQTTTCAGESCNGRRVQIWREGGALVVRGAMTRLGSCEMPDDLNELETTVLRFVPFERLTAAAEEQARRLGVDQRQCNYKTDHRTGPPRRCWGGTPAQIIKGAAAQLVWRALEFGKEVTRVERSRRGAPLEGLLRRGNDLAAELRPNIEYLSVEDYRSVGRGMKGYVVTREEVIIVEPDSRFFSKLAGEIGTTQDRLYFGYMLKVRPNGYWPAYVTRQTDAGGCIEFGSGSLSALYQEGRTLLPKLTGYYGRQLESTVDDIGRQITEGTCACGKRSSVMEELRTFLEMNPTAPVANAVRARLSALEGGAQVVREECVGGR